MFCPKCGQLNLDKVQSCQKCGARLPVSDGASAAAPVGQAVVATGIYAGFWKRFAAFIIDYFIVVALSLLAGAIVGFLYGISSGGVNKDASETLGGLAGIAMWWLYYAVMESSSKQATLGKMALGIRVVDRQGGRISFARATGRHFAKLLSGLIMMIGYMMAGFTSRKQALHDMIAGCLVVNRNAPEDLIQQGVVVSGSGMPVWAIILIVLAVSVFPLGILAAIALPAYHDYTVRAKVSMAMQAGRQATVAIEEFYVANKKLPGDLREAGVPAPDSKYVRSVSMGPTGAVRIVLADPALDGQSILFEPAVAGDGRITWSCSSSDVKQRYLPTSCRK